MLALYRILNQSYDTSKGEPTTFIYPMHKTVDEVKEERSRKAKEARATLKAKRELARSNRLATR